MNAELQTFIDSLSLKYRFDFVPQSMSRNAGEKHKSLNWRVTIAKGARTIGTDYTQGIGYLPSVKPVGGRLQVHADNEALAAEQGIYRPNVHAPRQTKGLPAPALADVLYSLVSDSTAIDQSFDDWCADFGYDTDSRKAYATYETCRDYGLKLVAMMGRANLEKLRELFSDY